MKKEKSLKEIVEENAKKTFDKNPDFFKDVANL